MLNDVWFCNDHLVRSIKLLLFFGEVNGQVTLFGEVNGQ